LLSVAFTGNNLGRVDGDALRAENTQKKMSWFLITKCHLSLLDEKALALLARQSQNTISLADWMTFRYAKTAAFPTFFLAFNSKSSQRAQWCTLIQQVAL
jgi:hypothetical protein